MKFSGVIDPAGVLEHSSDGFFVTDVQGKLLYCNPATNPPVGMDMFEFNSMGNLLKHSLINCSTALEAIQKKSTVSEEVLSITGKRVIATPSFVYDLNGNPERVICNVRNISAFLSDKGENIISREAEIKQWNIVKIKKRP